MLFLSLLRVACFASAAAIGFQLLPFAWIAAPVAAFAAIGLAYGVSIEAGISRHMSELGMQKRKFGMPFIRLMLLDTVRATIICGGLYGAARWLRYAL